MKFPALTFLLALSMLVLFSCKKTNDSPDIVKEDEQIIKKTIPLPFSITAPGKDLFQAESLVDLINSPRLPLITEKNMAQFLVAEEIEQALGEQPNSEVVPLPPGQVIYKEVGMVAMPNYRLVIFVKSSNQEEKTSHSAILRTFCYDGTLMGSKRFAHWDQTENLEISGTLDPFLKLTLYLQNKGSSQFQIDEFGKIIPISS